ncbi:hypothetical protein [Catenulispora rubra]|uniref:hypothetical protein n=1 Tax=Catenulispora rubra TaxID=280293 RepID=UPI001E50DCE2|nr:hypothetical protein [Catenulispora rubra]
MADGQDATRDDKEALLEEFAKLRHGWGLEATNLRGRIGPQLRRLCGVRADAGDREIRRRVLTVLRELSAAFPEHDRQALAFALATAPGTQLPRLTERVDMLAQRFSCADRTARRRIIRAFDRLAEEALARIAAGEETGEDLDKGWYVSRLESLLRLDCATPELIERRTIVSRRDGLRRIAIRFSLPRPDGAQSTGTPVDATVVADVQQGARIESREREGEAHFRFVLTLPRPLRQGDQHTYTMVFRVPDSQPMRPHYAFVPLLPCDEFQLRVRFDPQHPPAAVWRFQRVPPRVLNDRMVPGESLDLDEAGEVVLDFSRPETGFGYGVGWVL